MFYLSFDLCGNISLLLKLEEMSLFGKSIIQFSFYTIYFSVDIYIKVVLLL